jgi:hypothetical protein
VPPRAAKIDAMLDISAAGKGVRRQIRDLDHKKTTESWIGSRIQERKSSFAGK